MSTFAQRDEKEWLQGKLAIRESSAQRQSIVGKTESRSGMPSPLKAGLEALSGMDLSGVRVHSNSSKPAQLRALAYTQGQDIYVGPGQEAHLSHEGWHAVQQMQGRVEPMMQAKGVSINDDEALEREADVMGTKALQIRPTARTSMASDNYEPPALQGRTQTHISRLSKPVIQRQLVKTWGGEWGASTYQLDDENSPNWRGKLQPGRMVTGVVMQLAFIPGENVNAERIGLAQTSQAFVGNQPSPAAGDTTNPARSIQSTDDIPINTGQQETDEATHIDKAPKFNNPIYPVQSEHSSSLADTNTSPKYLGRFGFHYTDANNQLRHQVALLNDNPIREGPAAKKDSRMIFETAAIATKGVQTGTYYGSVRWGWRTDSSGQHSALPISKVSDGVPSSTFMKAAELWNASQSSTGEKTLDLPTVDVQVTTAPITGVDPPGHFGPPLTIPTGTRVQIIRTATPPNTTGEIRVVDGGHTGTTLEVTLADMANLQDERP